MKPVIDRMMWLAAKIAETEGRISTLSRFGSVRKETKRTLFVLKCEFELLESILITSGGAA